MGGQGTISMIGWLGKASARAVPNGSERAAPTARTVRRRSAPGEGTSAREPFEG
jgi:hypothetical protein